MHIAHKTTFLSTTPDNFLSEIYSCNKSTKTKYSIHSTKYSFLRQKLYQQIPLQNIMSMILKILNFGMSSKRRIEHFAWGYRYWIDHSAVAYNMPIIYPAFDYDGIQKFNSM